MKKSLFIALLSLQSLWWSAASGQVTYFPTTPEEEQLAEDCRKSLPEQEKYEVALIEHFFVVVEKTNAPNANPFVEDCSTVAVSNSSDYEMREILRLVDGPRAGLCSDVLILVYGNPVVCDYDRKLARGITYKPTTAEQKDVEAACMENLMGTRTALVLYEANPKEEFRGYDLYDTLLPDDGNPYNEEECGSLSEPQEKANESRTYIFINESETCHDVLYYEDGENPVVCLPVVCDSDDKCATGITNYKPTTAEQKDVEAACMENLKGPNGTRTALVLYEANPKEGFPGYDLYDTLLPDDGDPYNQEECSSLFEPQEEANESRTFIFIIQSGTCHDVLYYEDGENPVVCLYILPDNTTTRHVAAKAPAIVVLVFTSLSVIASAALLVT